MHKLVKNVITTSLIIVVLFVFISCSNNSNNDFSITFIDVGQGDAALVSCDGCYMLIDGGPKNDDKVYNTLVNRNVTKLDYLIVSHMHEDHIGGLQKALAYVSTVERAFSIETNDNSDSFKDFYRELLIDGCKSIEIPKEGETYNLGRATIEIISADSPPPPNYENDSLVFLITYGDTSFLFTGDIDYRTEDKISDKYSDDFPITLLKVAHHGSESGTEGRFIRTTMPHYAVISVGVDNPYGHPNERVLSVLDQADVKQYRTDIRGSITVTSNGKNLSFKTEK